MNSKYEAPTIMHIDGPRKNAYGYYVGTFSFTDGTQRELRMLSSLYDNNKDALCAMIQVLFYGWVELYEQHKLTKQNQ